MRRLPLLLCLFGALLAWSPARAGDPPVDQTRLNSWWRAAAELTLGDTAYRVGGVHFEDGVCAADFNSGVFIPVWSGKAPVSERIVGAVFVGEGSLSVRFPERADAWLFSSWRQSRMGASTAEVAGIAAGGAPYTTKITRALLLSADEKVRDLLLELKPIGSGSVLKKTEEGIDEEYVVTEDRGKFKAEFVATNLLPGRRLQLERDGLDPTAFVRQDRLLHEELGVPASDLRLVADFRTEDRFGVAQLAGTTAGPQDYDQWMTCFRDGLGQSGTGFRSMAFSHGTDSDQRRHFQRWSGETFPREVGKAGPEPARWMAPVFADTTINVDPARWGNVQRVDVSSTLTVEARGGPMQAVALRLPTAGSVAGTWQITSLTDENGSPLAWTGLRADLAGEGLVAKRDDRTPPDAAATNGGDIPTTLVETSAADISSPSTAADSDLTRNLAESQLRTYNAADVETDLVSVTATRSEIIVLLPVPVAPGEKMKIRLNWKATWPYANWSSQGRPLGQTTGLQEVVPELIPALGGTAWDFKIKLIMPGRALRTYGIALSGDTVRDETNEEDGWRTVESEGSLAQRPAVALGRWHELVDPSAKGMPSVRVNLFVGQDDRLAMFPPEIRRVVSFLDRFLPDFPLKEVEVFQGKDTFVSTAMRSGIRESAYGLIGVQQVAVSEVGQDSALRNEDAHLMQTQIARQVAGQYWGQRVSPATARDAWIGDALMDVYAAFYVRAAFGTEAYTERIGAVRKGLEDPTERAATYKQVNDRQRPLSLTGSTDISDIPSKVRADYGFYVLAEMLRFRIGDQAFFKALDRLAKRRATQRITTEQLQEAFEETSEQDLSDFFDTWIHAGLVPRLRADVQMVQGANGTTVTGCLASDQIWGRYGVPLVITDHEGKRSVQALVSVVNGRGSFSLEGRDANAEVEIDPDGLILAYKRDVNVVTGTPTCE